MGYVREMSSLDAATRRLLWCGVIAGPLFVLVWLIEGFVRPDYSPLRHPVSSLSLGDGGWVQSLTFLVCGALTLAFAVGLWRLRESRWGPILVGLIGLGFIGAGLFATDPIGGYPPGTPDRLTTYTMSGALHQAFSALFFLGLPIACFVYARSLPRAWAVYSILSGIAFLITFVLAAMGFAQTPPFEPYGGLFQRLSIVIGEAWLTALALHSLAGAAAQQRS
jgi:hypothetical membrane protein